MAEGHAHFRLAAGAPKSWLQTKVRRAIGWEYTNESDSVVEFRGIGYNAMCLISGVSRLPIYVHFSALNRHSRRGLRKRLWIRTGGEKEPNAIQSE